MSPPVLSTPAEVRAFTAGVRRAGQPLALVPTMGFLHDGHSSLMEAARQAGHAVAVSIFVNPRQFGPAEDLARYPRDLAGDLARCHAAGVSAVYVPSVEVMYPAGFQTTVSLDRLTVDLEGRSRPGHFAGVATVVAKLLALFRPDRAYFGEKDFQQLLVVRALAVDLELGVEIVGCPTVREADGLARSSRNVYLSPDLRARARAIPAALKAAQGAVRAGQVDVAALVAGVRDAIDAVGLSVDYAEVRDARTLEPLSVIEHGRPARLLVAVFAGTTRLLDNVALEPARE